MPLQVTRSEPEDLPAVREFFETERELSGYASDALADERLVAWLAWDGDLLVGAILTRAIRSEEGRELGGVDELLVRVTHRSRGIGRRLMGSAEAYYRAHAFRGMQLTVREDNADARKLYESLGYAVVQRRLRMRKQFQ
jgi:ribosomal protein S18 acetylase RimI-like enzyme